MLRVTMAQDAIGGAHHPVAVTQKERFVLLVARLGPAIIMLFVTNA